MHLAGIFPDAMCRNVVLGRMADLVGLPHVPNACGLNEFWQPEQGLLNTPLPLEVLALLGPMPGHRHRIPVGLQTANAARSASAAKQNVRA